MTGVKSSHYGEDGETVRMRGRSEGMAGEGYVGVGVGRGREGRSPRGSDPPIIFFVSLKDPREGLC